MEKAQTNKPQVGDIMWAVWQEDLLPIVTPVIIEFVYEETADVRWYAAFDSQVEPFEERNHSFCFEDLYPTMQECLDALQKKIEQYARRNAGHLLIHLRSNDMEDDLAWKLLDVAAPYEEL